MGSNSAPEPPQETILVVEGEIFARVVLAQYLRECGYKVLEAANAQEAMSLLERREIQVDVVLIDIEIAGSIDGFSLAKWLRAKHPAVDVLLTGSIERAADAAAELCEEAPMPKPYHPQLAAERIRHLTALRAAREAKSR